MQLMMMQRQVTMEEEAADRRLERDRMEWQMELECIRREAEREEQRQMRQAELDEQKRQERRQDKRMNQMMQMAMTAFFMYNCKGGAVPNMFPSMNDSDSDDEEPSKKKQGTK
jgi:hypothetical protein